MNRYINKLKHICGSNVLINSFPTAYQTKVIHRNNQENTKITNGFDKYFLFPYFFILMSHLFFFF